MGIIDTVIRSNNDLDKPKKKSYWNYQLNVELINVDNIQNKMNLLPSEKRAMSHELSGKEPIEQAIVIKNTKKQLGRFTTNQIKEMFDDLGFNVDVILSDSFNSDFAAVKNI